MAPSLRVPPCLWFDGDAEEAAQFYVPTALVPLISDPASEKSQRAMAALLRMKKVDIAPIERVYGGER